MRNKRWRHHRHHHRHHHRYHHKSVLTSWWIIIIVVVLIIITLLIVGTNNSVFNTSSSTENASGLKKFLNSLSVIKPTNDCPQINVSLTKIPEMYPFIATREYDGWAIDDVDASGLFGINAGMIFCHKGVKEGQNPEYWYCGDELSGKTKMAYMQKTLLNKDGTIGKTIKQSFVNIYAANGEFIKTICGENPDILIEREWEQTKKEAEAFWS